MKVGVYCRVSGLSQRENNSLPYQRNLGEEFCRRNNYQFEVFEDVESGGKLNRKEFTKLLKQCKMGKIRGIWVYDNDRLGRDYDVSGDIRKLIQRYNLRLFIGWEEVKLEESKDRFNYNIRSVMSDYERMRINERFNYGKQRSFRNGKGLGIVGFGYQKDKNKNVIINENQSRIIQYIHKTYLRKDVKYLSDVEDRLFKKYGKIVDGKRLNGGLVGRVLGNEKYLGKVYREDYEGNRYEFEIGRIIDDKTFKKVKEKKERMKGIRVANTKNIYILKGKCKCGSCGSNMWIKRSGKVIKGKQYNFYYCNNEERRKKYERKFDKFVVEENTFRKNRKVDLKEYERMYGKFTDCDCINNNTISTEKLEELVWNSLYDFIIKKDSIKKQYQLRYKKELGEKDRFSNSLKYYKKEVAKLDERKLKMYDKWLDGEIDDEAKDLWERRNRSEIHKLNQKISDIEDEVKKLKSFNQFGSYYDLMVSDLKKEFRIKRRENRKRVIEKYVDSVYVKTLTNTNSVKEYEIKVKLIGDGGGSDDEGYELRVDNIRRVSSTLFNKLKNGFAQRDVLTYYSKSYSVNLILTYKYIVMNVGKSKKMKKNNRRLTKVE